MGLRRIPIRLCGNRENLFMGGDRELIMFSGVLSATLIFLGQELTAIIFGCLLWVFTLIACRIMAKADPKMRAIYLRHRKFKTYYPARSRPFHENTKTQKDY